MTLAQLFQVLQDKGVPESAEIEYIDISYPEAEDIRVEVKTEGGVTLVNMYN